MPIKDLEAKREYDRRWKAKRRADFFADKVCVRCGSITQLQLDHIDPKTKTAHNIWSWAESRRLAEIEKCQVLCHFCHVQKTWTEDGRHRVEHGTDTMYGKHHCRCEPCKLARSNAKKATRTRRKALGLPYQ